MNRRRIVITTAGSLGDLHPYIAIARELKTRGHDVTIASLDLYREKVEANGLRFHAIRALGAEWRPELAKEIMHAKTGPEYLVRQLAMPSLRDSYEDIAAAAQGADLLVSHPLTYATQIVAEKTTTPWVDSVLAPMSFFSAYDPPVMAPAPQLARLQFLGPMFHKPLLKLMKWTARQWTKPWHELRAELGLPRGIDPLFQSSQSEAPVLALFSSVLGAAQRDWPRKTTITGFPFFDEDGSTSLPAELVDFLTSGSAPIIFTLGSAAVMNPGPFYEHAAAAAKLLGRRALLLVGDDPLSCPPSLPDGVVAYAYAPFAAVFPYAAAVVHQGGVGTTAQAMRAGKPMLIMPYAFDQYDNAHRARRLGVGRFIDRRHATPKRLEAELRALLDPSYAKRAAEIGIALAAENGVIAASDSVEKLLN